MMYAVDSSAERRVKQVKCSDANTRFVVVDYLFSVCDDDNDTGGLIILSMMMMMMRQVCERITCL